MTRFSPSTCHSQPTPRCSYSWSSRLALADCEPTSALVWSWPSAQRATVTTPNTATPSVNRMVSTWLERRRSRARCTRMTLSPPTKHDIQAVTQAGTTTSPSAATPSAGQDRGGDDLQVGRERGEASHRQRQEQKRARDDFADHQPLRHLAPRAPDMGDRLGPRELHRGEIADRDRAGPAEQQRQVDVAVQGGGEDQRRDRIGRGEEGRELAARDQLRVAQAASSCRRRDRRRPATGQAIRRPEAGPRSCAYNGPVPRTSAHPLLSEQRLGARALLRG